MNKRSHLCVAFLAGASLVLASLAFVPRSFAQQDSGGSAAYPTYTSSTPVSTTMESAPASYTSAINASSDAYNANATLKPESAPRTTDISEGFAIPGGFNSAPLNFTPGQGHYDRPPLTFSTTASVGYDDNVASAPRHTPKQGSTTLSLNEGINLLIAQGRMGLSVNAHAGISYYTDAPHQHLFPVGGLDLVYGYKISPRLQFSSVISMAYQVGPSFSILNGLLDDNGRAYLVGSARFDLLYKVTPRFSMNTAYMVSGAHFDGGRNGFDRFSDNHLVHTFSESLRYAVSTNLNAVLEGRAELNTYGDSRNNSRNYFALIGFDSTLSRRLTAEARVGATFHDYEHITDGNDASFYAEAALNYILTRQTLLSWQLRYGYDNSSNYNGTGQTFRTGLNLSHSFSPKLRGNISFNYSHTDAAGVFPRTDSLSSGVGLNYIYNKDLSFYVNYSRIDQLSSAGYLEYTKNLYTIGASYSY